MAVPVTNEQPGIAARVVSSGAGVMLQFKQMTPDPLRGEIRHVLGDPAYEKAAERIRKAICDSGAAQRAAEVIEKSQTLVS